MIDIIRMAKTSPVEENGFKILLRVMGVA